MSSEDDMTENDKRSLIERVWIDAGSPFFGGELRLPIPPEVPIAPSDDDGPECMAVSAITYRRFTEAEYCNLIYGAKPVTAKWRWVIEGDLDGFKHRVIEVDTGMTI